MKTSLLAAAVLSVGSLPSFATIITQWTFEPDPIPTNVTGATITNIPASTGTGTASGTHASSSTVYSTPAGNATPNAFSADRWAVGDYFQFSLSTVGFTGIYLGYSQVSSNTGPAGFKIAYSTDGTNFTDFQAYTVLPNSTPDIPNAWSAGGPAVTATFYSYDLSAIVGLNNNPTVVFRLIDTNTVAAKSGSTFGTAGTNRVDDFTVADSPVPAPVPEPTTVLTLVSGLGMLGLLRRRTARA